MTLQDWSQITEISQNVFTVCATLIAALWAYSKFRQYERRSLTSAAEPVLAATVVARAFPGSSPTERILALTTTVTNPGRVTTTVDLDNSWFVVELASQIVVREGAVLNGPDGRPYLVQNALVDLATSTVRVKMGMIGPAVIRAGASISLASVCSVIPGIYRVTAEYAIAAGDLQYFNKLTSGYAPPVGSRIAWTASTIVDARLLSDEQLTASTGEAPKEAVGAG